MTKLKQISKALEMTSVSKETKSARCYKPYKPEPIFKIVPFSIPASKRPNAQRERFSKYYRFLLSFLTEDVVCLGKYAVVPIPQTSKYYMKIFDNQRNIGRAIDSLIQMGIISRYNEYYDFGKSNDALNVAKEYVVDVDKINAFCEYCDSANIVPYEIKSDIPEDKTGILFKEEDVKIGKVYLKCPSDWTREQFEEYLTDIYKRTNPIYSKYLPKVVYNNRAYFDDDPDRRIKFELSFTWGKGKRNQNCVTKIGTRMTSRFCNSRTVKDENLRDFLYREDLLKKYGLDYEEDVVASVPRLIYFLNTGDTLPMGVDVYRLMYNQFIRLCNENGYSEELDWDTERKVFKSLFMRACFDGDNVFVPHIKHETYSILGWSEEEWKVGGQVLLLYKKAIEDVIGKMKYGSEIFLHESCIYCDVIAKLGEIGKAKEEVDKEFEFKIAQVYDCFYANMKLENLGEIVNETTEEYYKEFRDYFISKYGEQDFVPSERILADIESGEITEEELSEIMDGETATIKTTTTIKMPKEGSNEYYEAIEREAEERKRKYRESILAKKAQRGKDSELKAKELAEFQERCIEETVREMNEQIRKERSEDFKKFQNKERDIEMSEEDIYEIVNSL